VTPSLSALKRRRAYFVSPLVGYENRNCFQVTSTLFLFKFQPLPSPHRFQKVLNGCVVCLIDAPGSAAGTARRLLSHVRCREIRR
jgi:hypothetical protein